MNILGIKNIFTDLRTLSLKMKLFIVGAIMLFTTTTTLSILHVGPGFVRDAKGWGWNILSMFSAFISVLNVALIANKKISNYFWGIISCILYGIYAWHKKYVGDSILNLVFYLPATFIGYKLWKPNMKNGSVVKRQWKWKYLPIIMISLVVIFVSWLFVLPEIPKIIDEKYGFDKYSWQHILDASTNTLGVLSTGLMYARIPLENICYLISNPMSITMWSIIDGLDINMIITYSFYFVVAIIGFSKWYELDLKIKDRLIRR